MPLLLWLQGGQWKSRSCPRQRQVHPLGCAQGSQALALTGHHAQGHQVWVQGKGGAEMRNTYGEMWVEGISGGVGALQCVWSSSIDGSQSAQILHYIWAIVFCNLHCICSGLHYDCSQSDFDSYHDNLAGYIENTMIATNCSRFALWWYRKGVLWLDIGCVECVPIHVLCLFFLYALQCRTSWWTTTVSARTSSCADMKVTMAMACSSQTLTVHYK